MKDDRELAVEDEKSIKVTEICCSVFGCGKILSMAEKLFGNKCIDHSIKIKNEQSRRNTGV